MSCLDARELLVQAAEHGKVYGIKAGWRSYLETKGWLTCLLIITLPLGLWLVMNAKRFRVGVTDEGFVIRWFGLRAYAWSEIETFRPLEPMYSDLGQSIFGTVASATLGSSVDTRTMSLTGPLRFKRKGDDVWTMIQAHQLENSLDLAREIEARTGMPLFPVDQRVDDAEHAEHADDEYDDVDDDEASEGEGV